MYRQVFLVTNHFSRFLGLAGGGTGLGGVLGGPPTPRPLVEPRGIQLAMVAAS